MINWEEEVNRIIAESTLTEQGPRLQFEDLIVALGKLSGAAELVAEMERLKGASTDALSLMVEQIAQIDFSDQTNARYYAAMAFVTWYLHDSWKSLCYPLPLQHLKVLAYIFLVGHELGRLTPGASHDPSAT